MKTQDLVASFCGQTFNSHADVIGWLVRNCRQLELDAYKAGMWKSADIVTDKYGYADIEGARQCILESIEKLTIESL